jgi:NAD(P) transhydrogenase
MSRRRWSTTCGASASRRAGNGAITQLEGGKRLVSDVVVVAAGRDGATAGLGLGAAGLPADARGRMAVDDAFRTSCAHIFAAGDVIGAPRLAATAQEQGRLAALSAFGRPQSIRPELHPRALYTIPEVSSVGWREPELTARGIPYVTGVAPYRQLARGELAGDRSGLLKLVVGVADRRLLGVHVFGTSATELVHIGQTVMAAGLPVDYLLETVFNVPTFADGYRVAAADAVSSMAA